MRPPRKCSVAGAGMVSFAVLRVADFRNAKRSTKIGREQRTSPVPDAIGGTSSGAKVRPTALARVAPSSWRTKSSHCIRNGYRAL